MSVTGEVLGGVVSRLPPSVIRSMASQYSAGATVQEAMAEVESLHHRGVASTVSVLGEAATSEAYARRHLDEVRSVLPELGKHHGLDVRLGVKLTALGVDVRPELAVANLVELTSQALEHGCTVELDMEQVGYADATLAAVRDTRRAGHANLAAVVQAYLHRTPADVDELVRDGVPTRIVKGAYKEGTRQALQQRESIRERFVSLATRYLEAGVPVGIGTHDEYVIVRLLDRIHRLGCTPGTYEFQMIMGIEEDLRQALVDAGHPVRATVHFGSDLHLWSIRRLRESPEIAGHAVTGVRHALRAKAGGTPAPTQTTPGTR